MRRVTVNVEPDDRLSLEQQVCFTLTVASREVISLYRPLLEPLGLTHPQWLVMVTLWGTAEPVTVKELSARLMLDPPTLSPLLKRLEAAGLVHRTRNPENERQVVVGLTPQGRALRARAGCLAEALLEVSGKSPEQLGKLNHDLRDLRDTIYSTGDEWNVASS